MSTTHNPLPDVGPFSECTDLPTCVEYRIRDGLVIITSTIEERGGEIRFTPDEFEQVCNEIAHGDTGNINPFGPDSPVRLRTLSSDSPCGAPLVMSRSDGTSDEILFDRAELWPFYDGVGSGAVSSKLNLTMVAAAV